MTVGMADAFGAGRLDRAAAIRSDGGILRWVRSVATRPLVRRRFLDETLGAFVGTPRRENLD
jgi:hypothetical protein